MDEGKKGRRHEGSAVAGGSSAFTVGKTKARRRPGRGWPIRQKEGQEREGSQTEGVLRSWDAHLGPMLLRRGNFKMY